MSVFQMAEWLFARHSRVKKTYLARCCSLYDTREERFIAHGLDVSFAYSSPSMTTAKPACYTSHCQFRLSINPSSGISSSRNGHRSRRQQHQPGSRDRVLGPDRRSHASATPSCRHPSANGQMLQKSIVVFVKPNW